MSAMLFSTARRRGRRWPYLLGALLVVSAAGGAILWFTGGKPPEDVSNPDGAFQSERPKRPRGERFV